LHLTQEHIWTPLNQNKMKKMRLKGSLINVVFRAIDSKNKELFSFNMNGEVKLNGELIHKYNLTKTFKSE